MLTTADDQTARIWDAASGQPMTPLLRHPGHVGQGDLDSSSRRFVTACTDGCVRLWELSEATQPIERLVTLAEVLSGRRLDAAGGSVPLEPEVLRQELEQLQIKP